MQFVDKITRGEALLKSLSEFVYQLRAMPHDHTEDQLVEQPAIGLFAELR